MIAWNKLKCQIGIALVYGLCHFIFCRRSSGLKLEF